MVEKCIIKSVVYCLFFLASVQLAKGGGDPGFMLPAPILTAGIDSLVAYDFSVFVRNALIP